MARYAGPGTASSDYGYGRDGSSAGGGAAGLWLMNKGFNVHPTSSQIHIKHPQSSTPDTDRVGIVVS